jgi:hypothetical protein
MSVSGDRTVTTLLRAWSAHDIRWNDPDREVVATQRDRKGRTSVTASDEPVFLVGEQDVEAGE